MIFAGQGDPAFEVGPTDRRRDPEREWLATCPLWITDESGQHRQVETPAVRADLARGAAGLPIPLAALDQVLGTEFWLRTLPKPHDPALHRERAHA